MTTQYFTNCVAVFEGGGVRGAAYAGAYAAAVDAGMNFNGVAGSSAGSIAAAFIATGGSPAAVKEKLFAVDLATLQRVPDKADVPFPPPGFLARALAWLPSEFAAKIAKFVRYSGVFNSEPVREWVETALRDMLAAGGGPALERPVRFSDLKIPLYIVAADVLQKTPKVWSTETTPEDSVAFAVQASCAIPFHFQAVKSTQSVFVDGGTISNLPSHVLSWKGGHPGRFSKKMLAFRLVADPSVPRAQFDDAADYAFSIADTVVASATMIQQALQEGIYPIKIGTGTIKSTDFDKITDQVKEQLFASGEKAVKDFVASEREVVGRHRVTTVYKGFDERLLAYVFAISEARNTIWFSDRSTYWLFFIYPIIASAVARGVAVKVVVRDPPKDDPVEVGRRQSLRSLGCDLVEVDKLSFTGLIVDYPGPDSIAVISSEEGKVGEDFDYGGEEVRLYRSRHDLPVIRNLGSALASQVQARGKGSAGRAEISIVPLEPEALFKALRKVPQYAEASFAIEEVPLDRLRVSQTHIKEFRLIQIERLIAELEKSGFDLFAPCQYKLPDGSFSIITPPVLEMVPQGPVIIEGHTRAFYIAQSRRDRFRAVVVSNASAPLPVTPRPFSEMRIADGTMPAKKILPDYDETLFRQIEAAVHP